MPTIHSEAIINYLRTFADARGAVSYADFSRAALFLPKHGYYAQQGRARVGKSTQTDFYTASSLRGGVFAQLILESFEKLLGREFCAQATLVEIGAEPGQGLFHSDKGAFKDAFCLRLGESLTIPKYAAVFANEWLDAQPFHSFRKTADGWKEIGVCLATNPLEECFLGSPSPHAADFIASCLNKYDIAEGYRLDLSLEASQCLEHICAQDWQGAFITADYGHFFDELIESFPEGTARAYRRHTVQNNLLEPPGEIDLTCDVCWDFLESVLSTHQFDGVCTRRQEAFFMQNALENIGKIVQIPDPSDARKRALAELLHPEQLGARFQVLSGVRRG